MVEVFLNCLVKRFVYSVKAVFYISRTQAVSILNQRHFTGTSYRE